MQATYGQTVSAQDAGKITTRDKSSDTRNPDRELSGICSLLGETRRVRLFTDLLLTADCRIYEADKFSVNY